MIRRNVQNEKLSKESSDFSLSVCNFLLRIGSNIYHYLYSHPKYKQVLREKMPCLACGKDDFGSDSRTQATAEISESQA